MYQIVVEMINSEPTVHKRLINTIPQISISTQLTKALQFPYFRTMTEESVPAELVDHIPQTKNERAVSSFRFEQCLTNLFIVNIKNSEVR